MLNPNHKWQMDKPSTGNRHPCQRTVSVSKPAGHIRWNSARLSAVTHQLWPDNSAHMDSYHRSPASTIRCPESQDGSYISILASCILAQTLLSLCIHFYNLSLVVLQSFFYIYSMNDMKKLKRKYFFIFLDSKSLRIKPKL